jgi:hypothetical protein
MRTWLNLRLEYVKRFALRRTQQPAEGWAAGSTPQKDMRAVVAFYRRSRHSNGARYRRSLREAIPQALCPQVHNICAGPEHPIGFGRLTGYRRLGHTTGFQGLSVAQPGGRHLPSEKGHTSQRSDECGRHMLGRCLHQNFQRARGKPGAGPSRQGDAAVEQQPIRRHMGLST